MFCFASIIATSPLSCEITQPEILWHERIVALWKDGEYELAQDEICQLKQQHPESEVLPKLIEIEARLALELGDFAKAKTILASRSDLKDLYAKALFALEAYGELTMLRGENLEALQGLAHLKLKHFEKAKELLEKAEPSKSVLIGRIDALLQLGEKEKARVAIDTLMPFLNTDEKKAYRRLTALITQENRRALEILKALVAEGFSPASEDILDRLAYVDEPKERLDLIEEIENIAPRQKATLLTFWKGHTLAALGEYSKAKKAMLSALTAENLTEEFEEKAKETLLYLAEKLEDEALAEFLVESAKEQAFRTKALDVKWHLATAHGKFMKALHIANESLKERTDKGSGLLLAAHSALQCKEYERVLSLALRFTHEGSNKHQQSVRDLLEAAAVKAKDKDAVLETLQQWQSTFGEDERLRYVECESLIALGKKDGACALLEKMPPSADRNSLLCICYSPGEPTRATAFGEMALALGDMRISSVAMHLELFNLYCDIANKALALPKGHPAFGKEPLDCAAEHLFAVFQENPNQISARNKAWACERFLANPKTHKRGLALFPHISNPSPRLILAAAKANPRSREAKELLRTALAQSEKSGDLALVCSVLTALGEVELKAGEKRAARTYFEKAAHMRVQSYDADVAKLALYKIDAEVGVVEKARAKSDLKDIQLRKTLAKEPLFLDAALLYVDICCENAPEKKQHLLEQMQEDFCSDSTLFGKHYQSERSKLQEKDELLKNYMRFVDLNIESIAAKGDKRRLRAALAKLESLAPAFKGASPELAVRCHALREQISSMLE